MDLASNLLVTFLNLPLFKERCGRLKSTDGVRHTFLRGAPSSRDSPTNVTVAIQYRCVVSSTQTDLPEDVETSCEEFSPK